MLDGTINYSDASIFENPTKEDESTKVSFKEFLKEKNYHMMISHQLVNSEALSYDNDKGERKLLFLENMTEIDIFSPKFFEEKKTDASYLSHSADGKLFYIYYNLKDKYRQNFLAQCTVYDFASKEKNSEIEPEPKAALQNVVWSSKGHSLAFVYNNNLYYNEDPLNNSKIVNITNTEMQKKNLGYGVADWIYEDILQDNIPVWWSPSDKNIAFISFNDEEVENVQIEVYGNKNEFNDTYQDVRYPKAGEVPKSKNPEVKAFVYRIDMKKIFNIPVPNGVPKDFYICLVRWIDDDNLLIGWKNREQNEAWLSISQNWHNNEVPVSWVIHHEKASNGWVDMFKSKSIEPIIVGGVPKMYIILNRVTGDTEYRNIAELTLSFTPNKTAIQKWIVTADFDFTDINYFDTSRFLYFSAILANDAKQLQLYKADIFTGNFTCISCSDVNCTYNQFDFYSNGRNIIKKCLGPSVPTFSLQEMDTNGTLIEKRILINNTALKQMLSTKAMPKIEFQKVTIRVNATNSIDLETKLILPATLKKDDKTQYPLLLNINAAPSTQTVTTMFVFDWLTFLVNNLKIIVLEVDGRGTINRGRQFERAIYKNLGIVEMHDQLLATEEMSKLPFINKDQIGAFGWTYGGYVVGHLLGYANNTLIRCGISIAPITSFDYYISYFAERFLGLKENNSLAYNQTDITRLAQNFLTKDFILVHGTKDDKVHFRHSVKLIQSLIAQGFTFEIMIYPDKGNWLKGEGTQKHVIKKLIIFLMNCYQKRSLHYNANIFN